MEQAAEQKLPEGFITKEEWVDKGRPEEEWRSPEEFIKRGEEILPIVKERKEKLEKEISEMREDMQRIIAFNEAEAKRNREVGYKEALADIEAKKKEAVENADWETVKAEDEKKDKLVAEHKKIADEPKNVESAAFKEFKANNEWFGTDKEMTEWVNSAGVGILDKCFKDGVPEADAFKKVEEETKARFRDKFENKNRDNKPAVEGDAKNNSTRAKKNSWDDVDSSGKASFKRIKSAMELKNRKYTKEDFMKDYFA